MTSYNHVFLRIFSCVFDSIFYVSGAAFKQDKEI